jgi:hypothetical protein
MHMPVLVLMLALDACTVYETWAKNSMLPTAEVLCDGDPSSQHKCGIR